MPPADREPPVCEHCDAPMEWSDRLPGWWCANCDGTEAEAIAAAEEYEREQRDAEDERRASGCTCDEFGDYQCDVHGADAIEAQRAAHEAHTLCEALATVARLVPSVVGPRGHAQLLRQVRAAREKVEARCG